MLIKRPLRRSLCFSDHFEWQYIVLFMLSLPRLVFAARAASIHFLLSLALAFAFTALVFSIWFPLPYRELSGGRELFWLIVLVDVTCGPLLTLRIFMPRKPRLELLHDMAFVVGFQLMALSYGIYTLALARPVALVFEVDRFRAVSMTDLDKSDLSNAPRWLKTWSLSGPKLVGTRRTSNQKEMLENIEKSSVGIDTGQRPSWW